MFMQVGRDNIVHWVPEVFLYGLWGYSQVSAPRKKNYDFLSIKVTLYAQKMLVFRDSVLPRVASDLFRK